MKTKTNKEIVLIKSSIFILLWSLATKLAQNKLNAISIDAIIANLRGLLVQFFLFFSCKSEIAIWDILVVQTMIEVQ